ncbi:5'-nucleotidase, lipoprotein e(P4) family [Leucobacter tenebrionis]|uniref:5'-nucleotidase, lipoprotein e(P4) family n=1 Tax=Leucobacter tenebrionis TaxID=2873270 RepID=UPI001CA7ABAF|nr:HAD family acid phosphatase [Leucobacter tenebrionis]QZY51755.1 hypothetical protein KVY00_14540 [Leucobacter tenebrionis]
MPQPHRARTAILASLSLVAAGALLAGCAQPAASDSSKQTSASESEELNIYTVATAWRVTAAERDMLYRQGFNAAKDRLDAALAQPSDKPLAIVSDIDDTVLSSDSYWEQLISEGKQAFDDPMWDAWVEANGPTATPGSVEFLEYAKSKGVEVFYVSQRDQGERTQELGIANLEHAGLPFADDEHVTIQRDSSDKEAAQAEIADRYEVVVYLGDNLNDFARKYYVEDVEERRGLAEEDAEEFGRKFILFPNPTDGHWIKAIFGDSEPEDSPEYREGFREAAEGSAN